MKNITSKKIVNNVLIGVNCTSIALKYVIYFFIKSQNVIYVSFQSWIVNMFIYVIETLRFMNQMQFVDENIEETSNRIFKDVRNKL